MVEAKVESTDRANECGCGCGARVGGCRVGSARRDLAHVDPRLVGALEDAARAAERRKNEDDVRRVVRWLRYETPRAVPVHLSHTQCSILADEIEAPP